MRVTVDINVLLDVFQKREPHYAASARVLAMVQQGELSAVFPAHGFTPEEAVVILSALRERLEEHHGVALDDDALRAAVVWSVRYLPDFRVPDKALDLVDQACAAVRFRTLTPEMKSRDETPLARPAAGRGSYLRAGREGIAGVVAKRRMGFGMEEEEGGQDTHTPCEESGAGGGSFAGNPALRCASDG